MGKLWIRVLFFAALIAVQQGFFTSCGSGRFLSQQAVESVSLDVRAKSLLEQRCASCHGAGSPGHGGMASLNVDDLVAGQRLMAGEPDSSPVYVRAADQSMPPDQPLSEEETNLLREWIVSLAQDANVHHFPEIQSRILQAKCLSCHGPGNKVPLDSYTNVMRMVLRGEPRFSLLYETVVTNVSPPHEKLDAGLGDLLFQWITQGALN
ncbi:MAG: c-type cytochrome [Bdellovibrionales bacterium]